jgi:hypothetical protein
VPEEFDVTKLHSGLLDLLDAQFPETSTECEPSLGISMRSQFLAVRLDDAHHTPLLAFGLGPDEHRWKPVEKAAVEMKRTISALGGRWDA